MKGVTPPSPSCQLNPHTKPLTPCGESKAIEALDLGLDDKLRDEYLKRKRDGILII